MIVEWHSSSDNQAQTFTVEDVCQYKFLLIAVKYGQPLLCSHFIPSGLAVGHKEFNLYNGGTLVGKVTFNSNTSITITEYMAYSPIAVYAIM